MRRLLPLLLFALPVFAPAAPAAPVPKHLKKDQSTYYYPTTPGAKWVYVSTNREWVYIVTKVEDRKGTKVVTVESETDDKREPEEVMAVSATGFFRTHDSDGPIDKPLEILRVPFKVGDSWTFHFGGAEGTKTIGAIETIKVPAGTFEVVRVDTELKRGNQVRLTRWWYAPGVGMVQMSEGDTVVWTLKAFTPGKE